MSTLGCLAAFVGLAAFTGGVFVAFVVWRLSR